jgi:hypothetical protein
MLAVMGVVGSGVWWFVVLLWLLKPQVCCGSVKALLKWFGVIYQRRGEWPPVGESVIVGLGVTGVEAEFSVDVDACCNRRLPDLLNIAAEGKMNSVFCDQNSRCFFFLNSEFFFFKINWI